MPSGWPSGWNVYYIVFVAGALSLVAPVLLALLSYLFSARRTPADDLSSEPSHAFSPEESSEESNPSAPRKRTNPRAFIALSSALVLFVMALLILPCVVTLSSSPVLGLISILSVCSLAGLGLLYGIRKGDLEWLLTFNKEKEPRL